MDYLVDSSILSQLFRKGDSAQRCQQWLRDHPNLYTSVIVIYEVESSLIHGQMPKALTAFKKFTDNAPVKILDVNQEIASLAAAKRAETLKNGLTLHAQDLLIGATAAHHGLQIVTANEKDFRCWGRLENPLRQGIPSE